MAFPRWIETDSRCNRYWRARGSIVAFRILLARSWRNAMYCVLSTYRVLARYLWLACVNSTKCWDVNDVSRSREMGSVDPWVTRFDWQRFHEMQWKCVETAANDSSFVASLLIHVVLIPTCACSLLDYFECFSATVVDFPSNQCTLCSTVLQHATTRHCPTAY